jgi:hypothetical protein
MTNLIFVLLVIAAYWSRHLRPALSLVLRHSIDIRHWSFKAAGITYVRTF